MDLAATAAGEAAGKAVLQKHRTASVRQLVLLSWGSSREQLFFGSCCQCYDHKQKGARYSATGAAAETIRAGGGTERLLPPPMMWQQQQHLLGQCRFRLAPLQKWAITSSESPHCVPVSGSLVLHYR